MSKKPSFNPRQVTTEESIQAGKSLLEPILDNSGATIALSAKTIAKQHRNKNGQVALKAAEMNLRVRGYFVERHQVDVPGLEEVLAGIREKREKK